MKIKTFLLVIVAILLLSIILISSQNIFSADLKKGRNTLIINLTSPIYAETLVKLNPEIQTISYRENNQTTGYVNFYGGIGENFIIESREYEIVVSKDINLILPE